MATHSSVLAWRIPGMRKPGGLLSMGSHRVGHDWSDLAAVAAAGKVTGEKRGQLWRLKCGRSCRGEVREEKFLVGQEKLSWRSWHFRWAEGVHVNGKSREMRRKAIPDRMTWAEAGEDEKNAVLLGGWSRAEKGGWRAAVAEGPGPQVALCAGAVQAGPSLQQSFPERRPTSSCLLRT